MQRLIQHEAEILNNREELQESVLNDTVKLESLSTATYHRSQGRSSRGRPQKSMNNLPLIETDTEAEEDDLLLSPGKRKQR